jgi:hypothetical protein
MKMKEKKMPAKAPAKKGAFPAFLMKGKGAKKAKK